MARKKKILLDNDGVDKMLKEVRLPIGQVQTDIPLTCLLFKEYVPRNDQLKNR